MNICTAPLCICSSLLDVLGNFIKGLTEAVGGGNKISNEVIKSNTVINWTKFKMFNVNMFFAIPDTSAKLFDILFFSMWFYGLLNLFYHCLS